MLLTKFKTKVSEILVISMKRCLVDKSSIQCVRIPPATGEIKLNVDAGFKNNLAVTGVVARNSNAETIGIRIFKGMAHSCTEAKAFVVGATINLLLTKDG